MMSDIWFDPYDSGPFDWTELRSATRAAPLVDGLLPSRGIAALYGPTNCGKSFLALDLAAHVATGRPWAGRAVKQGKVLYLAAEGAFGLLPRLEALSAEFDIPGDHLRLITSAKNLGGDSRDTQHLLDIRDDFALIVVDTVGRTIGGNENSPDDMAAFLKNVDRLGREHKAAILLLHHSGKDQHKGMRGHSAFSAAIDTELRLTRRGDLVAAEVTKQRDGPAGEVLRFRQETVSVDGLGNSCRLRFIDVAAVAAVPPPVNPAETAAFAALHSLQVPAEGLAVTDLKLQLAEVVACASPNPDSKRRSVDRAIARLETLPGLVFRDGRVFLHE